MIGSSPRLRSKTNTTEKSKKTDEREEKKKRNSLLGGLVWVYELVETRWRKFCRRRSCVMGSRGAFSRSASVSLPVQRFTDRPPPSSVPASLSQPLPPSQPLPSQPLPACLPLPASPTPEPGAGADQERPSPRRHTAPLRALKAETAHTVGSDTGGSDPVGSDPADVRQTPL